MNYIDSSHDVIIFYILDINYYFKEYVKHLFKKSSSNIEIHLNQVYSEITHSQYYYAKKLNPLKDITTEHNWNKNFNFKFIHKNIFSNLHVNYLQNFDDLYELLICIEQRTVLFFEKHFNSFPYIHSKCIINEFINEKNKNVQKYKQYKSKQAK